MGLSNRGQVAKDLLSEEIYQKTRYLKNSKEGIWFPHVPSGDYGQDSRELGWGKKFRLL
jgi:hypothetical protein